MITSIVFSKNRACQLDLFLLSVEKNFKDTDEIFVIYQHTDDLFQKAYDILIERFSKNNQIQFIPESNFQKDTINACEKAKNKYIAFFVDDDIMYRPISIGGLLEKAFSLDMACVSLRLGGNITVQDFYAAFVDKESAGSSPKQPRIHDVISGNNEDDLFVWNWSSLYRHHTNFGYPFSVDGHIYTKEDTLPIVQRYEYHTPNALEGRFTGSLKRNMSCLGTSSVVNTPLNLVGSSQNRAGEQFGMSLEELNNKYIEGFRISLEDMDFSNIVSCHQELPITFKQGD